MSFITVYVHSNKNDERTIVACLTIRLFSLWLTCRHCFGKYSIFFRAERFIEKCASHKVNCLNTGASLHIWTCRSSRLVQPSERLSVFALYTQYDDVWTRHPTQQNWRLPLTWLWWLPLRLSKHQQKPTQNVGLGIAQPWMINIYKLVLVILK